MFDHLVTAEDAQFVPDIISDAADCDFVPEKSLTPSEAVDAKFNTSEWLKDLGAISDEEALSLGEQKAATEAFASLALPTTSIEDQKRAVSSVQTPQAVRHLVGMLTAYDWNFVEQAQSMRSYAVSKILEETAHPDARIRLKALDMLGRVTEVSLFTERIEIKKTNMSDAELEEQIRAKLKRFVMGAATANAVDGEIVSAEKEKNSVENERTNAENAQIRVSDD